MDPITKTVYLFDGITGEYTGAYAAQEDPMSPGDFITPIYYLEEPPPAITPGSFTVAVAQDGEWVIVPDYRHVALYSTEDGAIITVTAIGPMPANATLLPRPFGTKWGGSDWIEDFALVGPAELAAFRKSRRDMFAVIADMAWVAMAMEDTAAVSALLTFRQGVKGMPAWPAVAAATTLVGLKAALKARYQTLTDALPTGLKDEFRELAS